MKSLIWKQYQESKIHFLIFSAWMILAVCYTIGYELAHKFHAVIGSFSGSAMLFSVMAAIVLAARSSQGEQTDGTLAFTTSLPISMRRVASVRILGAILTLALPILIAAFILAASLTIGLVEQGEPRSPNAYVRLPSRPVEPLLPTLEHLASVTAISVLEGASLLLILSLCGCWLRNQAQIGLLGAVLALGSLSASELLWFGIRWPFGQLLYGAILPQSLVIQWGFGESTGDYSDHELALYRWGALGLALPVLALLGISFVMRYGKSQYRAARSTRFPLLVPPLLSRLPISVRSRWFALVWLELRQSIPLTLCGLLLAVLITIADQWLTHWTLQDVSASIRSGLPHSMFFVGMLWAVVVASSLYSADLDSELGSFRRTLPISPSMWFWNKFLLGLAAVLLVMDGATIFASWNSPRVSINDGMSYAYIACFPIIHALMYSLAVLGACVFRRPLIGGICAVICYTVATTAVTYFPGTMHLDPVNIYNELITTERASTVDLMQHSYPLVYGVLAISVIVSAFASSRFAKPLQQFYFFARLNR